MKYIHEKDVEPEPENVEDKEDVVEEEEKEEKEEFIHVLIKFYAVLEECMPVEEQKSLWRRLVEWAFPNTISGYSD